MKKPLEKICRMCGKLVIIMVNMKDIKKWKNGQSIQNAMHYLTAAEREMIISETCDDCFNKLFPPEEEE
jgi:hypothetical protein